MESHEIIRMLIEQRPNMTQHKLGGKIGFIPQTMSKRMNARRLGVDFFVKALTGLDYKLVAIPKDDRLPRNAILVTAEEE